MNWVELVGYVASGLVVLSFAMSSIVKIRLISLVGSAFYVCYGVLIGSVPIILANATIVVFHCVALYREFSQRSELGATPIDPQAPFLTDFLASHIEDIRRSQPEYESSTSDTAFILMREGMPAGVLLGNSAGAELRLNLDYVLPAYRDSRLGQWIYGNRSSALRGHGIRKVVAAPTTDLQRNYLLHVGFEPAGTTLVRELGQ